MVRLLRTTVGLQLLAFRALVAQQPLSWKVYGDTTGGAPGCTAAGIAAITAGFTAFPNADSAGLAEAMAMPFVFSTGKFTPSDTFVRIESLGALIRYTRARLLHHERITLEAVRFYGWRELRLGFMPYFTRSADDLGQKPLAGIGKAEYWCGLGVRVLNLGPRPSYDPGPGHRIPSRRPGPPNKRLKLTGVDRSRGSGVLCPWRGTDYVPRPCAGGRVARSLSAIR